MIKLLPTPEDFIALLESGWEFIIFKHSSRCSISNKGCQEVFSTIESLWLDNMYLVDVLWQKELSHHIATVSGIQHESPQILFFKKWKVYAHWSHSQVNERNIRHILWGWRAGKEK